MSTVSSAIHNGIASDYEDAKLYAQLRQEQPKAFMISLTAIKPKSKTST